MEWSFIAGSWGQIRENLRKQWARLTNRQVDAIAGHRERLASTIRDIYGMTRDEAEIQIKVFENRERDFRN